MNGQHPPATLTPGNWVKAIIAAFSRAEKVDRASLSSKPVSLSGKSQPFEGDRDSA
jgi:hypothetical protein